MNVLIVPEDFRKDQYVLLPIVQRMLREVGKPNANVRMCLDPLMGGIGEATKWERIAEMIQMYPMVQLFLLVVDRDGNEGRRVALDALEKKAADLLNDPRILLAENAWQEVEIWRLAGQKLPKDWNFQYLS